MEISSSCFFRFPRAGLNQQIKISAILFHHETLDEVMDVRDDESFLRHCRVRPR